MLCPVLLDDRVGHDVRDDPVLALRKHGCILTEVLGTSRSWFKDYKQKSNLKHQKSQFLKRENIFKTINHPCTLR